MQVSIIGDAAASDKLLHTAYDLGSELASQGCTIITGGMSGVMEAASQGAHQASGIVVAILPSYEHSSANPYTNVVIATGMGHARNVIVAASGDIVVSVGGGSGTWSETAHALKLGKKVIALLPKHTIPGVIVVNSVSEAINAIFGEEL